MWLCGSERLCVSGSPTTPIPLYFQGKDGSGKNIPAFWSPMQCCVSPALGEAVGKAVSPQSCSPDLAFSTPGAVRALWLVVTVTRAALLSGKERNKNRQCFTEDSVWPWKSCATWLILCKGHEITTASHMRDASWAWIKKKKKSSSRKGIQACA